jgi:hypothetical protein
MEELKKLFEDFREIFTHSIEDIHFDKETIREILYRPIIVREEIEFDVEIS